MIMTYALCGFANIASVGINVAGYSVLAPNRRDEVIALVWKALAAGFLATCMTASLVGALPAALFGPVGPRSHPKPLVGGKFLSAATEIGAAAHISVRGQTG